MCTFAGATILSLLVVATTTGCSGSGGSTCAVDLLCLAPTPVAGGRTVAGHLAVVWFQMNDDRKVEPTIAYQADLAAGAARIDIPLAALAPPRDDLLLRVTTPDLCTGASASLGVGTAAVVVTAAPVTAAELTNAELTGVGWLLLGFSPESHTPAPCPYDRLFPQGIQAGVKPYSVIHPPTGFDQAGIPAPGTVLELRMCSEGVPSCRVTGPNFT
jgi:hypothetical protein